MRITGGELRGRLLRVPGAGVRPTQDRVRSALFSILGARVPGSRFLDLFAGSGAVGLEAWSRGAAHVCWVDSGRHVASVLKQNVDGMCSARKQVCGQDVFLALKKMLVGDPYDIIFSDPPYDRENLRDVQGRVLEAVDAAGALAPGGLVVLEQNVRQEPPPGNAWRVADCRDYGETRLVFLVKAAK